MGYLQRKARRDKCRCVKRKCCHDCLTARFRPHLMRAMGRSLIRFRVDRLSRTRFGAHAQRTARLTRAQVSSRVDLDLVINLNRYMYHRSVACACSCGNAHLDTCTQLYSDLCFSRTDGPSSIRICAQHVPSDPSDAREVFIFKKSTRGHATTHRSRLSFVRACRATVDLVSIVACIQLIT